MIQRIQTIFMLIVVLIGAVLPLIIPIFTVNGQGGYVYDSNIAIGILFTVSAVMALYAIFSYKARPRQVLLNNLNTIVNFILLGLLIRMLSSSGEGVPSVKGVGVALPVLSIVFLFLANQAIKRDERLVKSADRLR
ncbi:protein of unknown function [Capnocytophaga haemolytica]|uniref:Transcription termination factor Rho n=1 Tax=Capnocytophaga haemolytica TaxID=45243 RepID=A0AAX2GVK0_9FLAO|nr:DUF4293 domain-containing protein [Capnocytophaga haemolytica]AMD85464.1 hypothetical protein AXF12_08030 [Capnocytophaga haemolytica]SFO29194.1 protein of unknown function [Capnocytophaga haemolytica]SNV01297.1 Uncharacterised protein [Capnocytophaga haemolytica]